MLGSVLGAAVCFPLGDLSEPLTCIKTKIKPLKINMKVKLIGSYKLGWLHLKLVEKANEETPIVPESNNTKSGVGAAIERLGGNTSE